MKGIIWYESGNMEKAIKVAKDQGAHVQGNTIIIPSTKAIPYQAFKYY